MKFLVRYQGSIEAAWRSSRLVVLPDVYHPFQCQGDDPSGTLTSSVRLGRTPFFISVGHELGGRPLHVWFRPPNGMVKGATSFLGNAYNRARFHHRIAE